MSNSKMQKDVQVVTDFVMEANVRVALSDMLMNGELSAFVENGDIYFQCRARESLAEVVPEDRSSPRS